MLRLNSRWETLFPGLSWIHPNKRQAATTEIFTTFVKKGHHHFFPLTDRSACRIPTTCQTDPHLSYLCYMLRSTSVAELVQHFYRSVFSLHLPANVSESYLPPTQSNYHTTWQHAHKHHIWNRSFLFSFSSDPYHSKDPYGIHQFC